VVILIGKLIVDLVDDGFLDDFGWWMTMVDGTWLITCLHADLLAGSLSLLISCDN
jgi:hypothetical protein